MGVGKEELFITTLFQKIFLKICSTKRVFPFVLWLNLPPLENFDWNKKLFQISTQSKSEFSTRHFLHSILSRFPSKVYCQGISTAIAHWELNCQSVCIKLTFDTTDYCSDIFLKSLCRVKSLKRNDWSIFTASTRLRWIFDGISRKEMFPLSST